jgi:hypothetical protein
MLKKTNSGQALHEQPLLSTRKVAVAAADVTAPQAVSLSPRLAAEKLLFCISERLYRLRKKHMFCIRARL